MFVSYGCCVLNINHIFTASFFSIHVVANIVRAYFTYKNVLMDFSLLIIVIFIALITFNYNRERFSKQFFLQQKKIEALHFEQEEIFGILPDGVMIHEFKQSEN